MHFKLLFMLCIMYFQILAILAAVTEVIKTEGGTETETEYFAALVGFFTHFKFSLYEWIDG